MRLPESQIKEAILHPEKMVRQDALIHFTESFSQDTEVMPLAIKAIETYGRNDAFPYVHLLNDLAQTEATVDWAIGELNRSEDVDDSYSISISRLLTNADPQFLIPRAKDILQAPGFCDEVIEVLEDLLELATWDAKRLWAELEKTVSAAL